MGVNNYKTSKLGKDLIKHYEGFRDTSYVCPAGVLTIGYGHTKGVTANQKITKEQGDTFLSEDLADAEKAVNSFVKVAIKSHQFDALVCFVFNLGSGNFKTSTLLKKINNNDFEGATKEFGRWVNSNGKPLEGLRKRRKSEAELFELGELNLY